MNAVGLVERCDQRDAFEKERVQHGPVLGRQLWIDGVEIAAIGGVEIERCAHAGNKRREIPFGKAAEQTVHRLARAGRIDAAQDVIAAEHDDHAVGALAKRPVEPRGRRLDGVAGDAGIDDFDIVPAPGQSGFKLLREPLAGIKPVAGDEAVSERHDLDWRRTIPRCHPSRSGKLHSRLRRNGCDKQDGRHGEEQAPDRTGNPLMAETGTDGTGDHAIALRDVHVTLGAAAARVHVLRGIDLNIGHGEAVGIVGPSGSGKSTLLMVMAGLEQAGSGSVAVIGQELSRLNEDALARFRGRHAGVVFQAFHLIPTMTALENVAIPLDLAGVRDAERKARDELAAVGLEDRAGHYPAQLSGGEQQRVALARALVGEPDILFADEPTGNLDGATGMQIADLIFDLRKQRGSTLVLVTHDETLAHRCSRVVRMADGLIQGEEPGAAYHPTTAADLKAVS